MLSAAKALEQTILKAATMGGIMGQRAGGAFPGRMNKDSAAVIRVSAGICGLLKKEFLQGFS